MKLAKNVQKCEHHIFCHNYVFRMYQTYNQDVVVQNLAEDLGT